MKNNASSYGASTSRSYITDREIMMPRWRAFHGVPEHPQARTSPSKPPNGLYHECIRFGTMLSINKAANAARFLTTGGGIATRPSFQIRVAACPDLTWPRAQGP